MTGENCQGRSEMVSSLASTIHRRIVSPVAEKTDTINLEIAAINNKVADLELKLNLINETLNRTRLIAAGAALGAVVIAIYLIRSPL